MICIIGVGTSDHNIVYPFQSVVSEEKASLLWQQVDSAKVIIYDMEG